MATYRQGAVHRVAMSLLTTVERRGPESPVAHTLQVTPDNFVRAETDMQFMTVVKRGGFGRLF